MRNFSGLINFVNLSTTFFIQRFLTFFISFIKTRFLTFFILGGQHFLHPWIVVRCQTTTSTLSAWQRYYASIISSILTPSGATTITTNTNINLKVMIMVLIVQQFIDIFVFITNSKNLVVSARCMSTFHFLTQLETIKTTTIMY